MVTEVCRTLVVNSEPTKEGIGRRQNFLYLVLRPNFSSFQNLHAITPALMCSPFKFMKIFHIKSITRTHHTLEGETKFHSTPINKCMRWIPYYKALQVFFLIPTLTPWLCGSYVQKTAGFINIINAFFNFRWTSVICLVEVQLETTLAL